MPTICNWQKMKKKLFKHRSYIYSEMLNALALAPTNVRVSKFVELSVVLSVMFFQH